MNRKAVAFMLLSTLCFSGMAVFIRLSPEIPFGYKIFSRNLVITLFMLVLLPFRKEKISLDRSIWKLVILRGIFGTLGLLTYFYSLQHIPMAEAALLNRLSPFVTTLFAIIFLSEKPDGIVFLTLTMALLGAAFVIAGPELSGLFRGSSGKQLIPALSGLASALFAGAAYTVIRGLKGRAPTVIIILSFSVISLLVSIPFMIQNPYPISKIALLKLGMIGLGAMGGQWFLTMAYTREQASRISVFNYVTIPVSMILGLLFLGEQPEWTGLAGSVLIIGGGLLMYFYRKKRTAE